MTCISVWLKRYTGMKRPRCTYNLKILVIKAIYGMNLEDKMDFIPFTVHYYYYVVKWVQERKKANCLLARRPSNMKRNGFMRVYWEISQKFIFPLFDMDSWNAVLHSYVQCLHYARNCYRWLSWQMVLFTIVSGWNKSVNEWKKWQLENRLQTHFFYLFATHAKLNN